LASSSADKFFSISKNADKLYCLAHDARLQPSNLETKYSYYHAALAVYVSGWDAYINNIIAEFFNITSDPLNSKYQLMHELARLHSIKKLAKFNTPNWENTRILLTECTGFDPMTHWQWTRRGKNIHESKELLNEILKIRHSFAHGFIMPAFSWNQSNTGVPRLTKKNIEDIEAFFKHLVNSTDTGLSTHIQSSYGVLTAW
jgi:hypothetical protein